MLMLDGIKAALSAGKTPKELEASISKKAGEEDFYLEKDREYRSEENVFEFYTPEEREKLFGKAPATVWENFKALDEHPDMLKKITKGDPVMELIVKSFREQLTTKWYTELHDRQIPNTMDFVRRCTKQHVETDATDFDIMNWRRVDELRKYMGKDYLESLSLLSRAQIAIDEKDFDLVSELEIEIQKKTEELRKLYRTYTKNLF